MRKRMYAGVLAAAIGMAACSENGSNPIDLNDKTGTVSGVAYIDQDGDGAFDSRFDVPAPGAMTALVLDGTTDTVARATTGPSGVFLMREVPVGRYELVANRGSLGDSVAVLSIDSAHFVLPVGDTAFRAIRLGFPVLTASQLATHPAGRRVAIEGIALNSWAAFGDSTIHVWDGTSAIRAIRVAPSAVAAGDSIRLIGNVGVSNGRPALVDAIPRVLSGGRGLPPVDSIATAVAATAQSGSRAYAQARIGNAVITDTSRFDGDRVVTVNDGSGPVAVVLDKNIAFTGLQLVPGATLRASGLLVPAPQGDAWQLKPRSPTDVAAQFPTSTIAAARGLPSGTRVQIEGKLLNSWVTYGDSTIHVLDPTGTIRAIRVTPFAAQPGDSVRIFGTTGVSNGRPVISDAIVSLLGTARGVPPADSVSTGAASTALNGTRADGLVRIAGSVIQDTTRLPSGDLQIGVDDGSGRLVVTLDAQISFDPGPYVPGALFNATGLLVPLSGGGWTLKPRERAEASFSFPTITVADAKSFVLGRRVFVEAVALTRWNAFGDSTIHIIDATGSMRAVRMAPSSVIAGDSVRLLATLATRNGSRVLSSGTTTILRTGVGAADPDSISTARAATADGGVLDANQVRVGGTVVGSQPMPNGDVVLTVDDGSGRMEVVVDAQSGFSATGLVPGMLVRISGVLIPTGTGTWQLYPRTQTEITGTFPSVTVAAARALSPGRTVFVVGKALNGLQTFGDQTVHLADATGSIRVVQLPSTTPIFQGDSIKVLGTVGQRDGQPVLIAGTAFVVLTAAGLPPADSVATDAAARATLPASDAAQVTVQGRITNVQTNAGGEVQMAIDDGSGILTVLLDKDVGFSAQYQIGNIARLRGVLVPEMVGRFWLLKPRQQADITILNAGDSAATSFTTRWREYVTGQQPAGWTTRWDRSPLFTIVDEPQATEKKLLQWNGNNPIRDHFALTYDGVADPADQQVYSEFRVRALGNDTTERRIGVVGVRIGGTSTDEHGYGLFMGQTKTNARKISLGYYINDKFVELSAFEFAWNEDVFYSVRLEVIGEEVHAKVWRRGTAEPEAWQVIGSAALYTSGRPGVVTQDSGIIQWDMFQVIIPTPPPVQ